MSGMGKFTLVVLFEDELLKVAECTKMVIAAAGDKNAVQDSDDIALCLQALVKSCSQAFHHIIQGKGKNQIVLLSRRDLKDSMTE